MTELPREQQRFLSHTKAEGDHLLWCGSVDGDGYGLFSVDGKTRRAARVSYALFKDTPLNPDWDVFRLCGHRACVAAAHLLAIPKWLRRGMPRRRRRSGVAVV